MSFLVAPTLSPWCSRNVTCSAAVFTYQVHYPVWKSLYVFDCCGFGTVQLDSLEKLQTFEHIVRGTRDFTFVNLPALENVHFKFVDDVHEGFIHRAWWSRAQAELKVVYLKAWDFARGLGLTTMAMTHIKHQQLSSGWRDAAALWSACSISQQRALWAAVLLRMECRQCRLVTTQHAWWWTGGQHGRATVPRG